jgi:hypothetical protein
MRGTIALAACGLFLLEGSVRAAGAVVTLSPTNARIQISGASLADAIDALSRSANFKVTYDGPRPAAMLFNTDIDTPTVAQTLLRLLEGQNLNYAAVLDLSGKNVTLLMVLGAPVRTASAPSGGSGGSGGTRAAQPFATPRAPRNEPPPDEPDDEPEAQPSPSPSATPTPVPPGTPPGGPPALPPSPYQVSPFAPRSPFGVAPIGPPRPSPSPSP